MKCLVTGGAGFIGSHVVETLLAHGHQVRVFDLPNISLSNLDNVTGMFEIVQGDFHNQRDLEEAFQDVQVVVHLVYTTLPGPSNENPIYDVESNVVGTLNLLEIARRHHVQKVIFSSSGGTVYGVPAQLPIPESHQTTPSCSYGITKLTIEKYLELYRHLYGLDYAVLRISNPYGERQRTEAVQGALAVFMGKVLAGDPITIWGDGSVARDYFYIKDLAVAFLKVVEQDTPSKIYNIGSGRAYTLMDIMASIENVTGKEVHKVFEPSRKLDVQVNCLDVTRAKKELGWQAMVSLEEGVTRMWRWLSRS